MMLKWLKDSINISEFAEAFGTNKEEMSSSCGELIKKLDFGYEIE